MGPKTLLDLPQTRPIFEDLEHLGSISSPKKSIGLDLDMGLGSLNPNTTQTLSLDPLRVRFATTNSYLLDSLQIWPIIQPKIILNSLQITYFIFS